MIEISEAMDQIWGNVGTLGETPGDGAVDLIGTRAKDGTEARTKITTDIKIGTEPITGVAEEDKVGAGAQDETPGVNHPPSNQVMRHPGDTHLSHTQHQQVMGKVKETIRRGRIQKTSRVGPIGPIPRFW